ILKGTKEATLKYRIQTDEYPYYVLSQSIYNDTWSLNVRGGASGQQLFDISRQINSQLSVPPVWQGDGTTGEIQEVLNVEALAANADVTLTLFASAMNVGDSILPTRVSASLSAETGLSIKSITPDTVTPTTGDSSFYSIPRPGSTNTYSRWFTLKITKPMNSTVTKMTSKLLGPGELMTIVDGPPGASFQVVDDQTLKVRVTMHDQASTVESTPPPAHNTKYRFKLAVDDNGTELTDEKDSGGRHALWRMPDGFGRYSTRDTGGDDWCSRGTYNWMDTNRSLLKEINDISGEHARNLGHATHQYGTDIDMFHFYRFQGATSGGNNYTRLQADTALSIRINDPDATVRQQAAAARARVSSWVTETRSGIDALAALNTVSSVLYAQGSAGSGLPAGWAQSLLTTGATTVGGAALDLGLGTWSNAKYRPRSDHNDHVHITLNRAALGD
ncbi:MAG TPA: hypothetical protein VFR03_20740, partial [Thermoanaerobaculia bacterium]|nr:hypothetical protein [Thermoanaerobaculia bacterium]